MSKPSRKTLAIRRCLPVGSRGMAETGWTCVVLAHVPSIEDGAQMSVRWDRSGMVSRVRPGRLTLVPS